MSSESICFQIVSVKISLLNDQGLHHIIFTTHYIQVSAEDIQGAIPTLLIVLYKHPLCYVPQLVLVVFQLQDSHFQYLSEMKEGITKLI